MKRFLFLFVGLCALIVSCSQLQVGGGTSVNVEGKQILARLADSGTSQFTIVLELKTDDGIQTIRQNGSISELKSRTYKFKNVPLNTTVLVACNIIHAAGTISEQIIYSGETLVEIKSSKQDVSIKMLAHDGPRGSFGSTEFNALCGDINKSEIETFFVPYGYKSIAATSTSKSVFNIDVCPNLTTIILPDTITQIESYAFKNCTRLSSINIPQNVTTISQYAFENCSSLTSITIPSGIETIGKSAFSGCTKLESVTILNGTPPTLYTDVFSGCTALKAIYVPKGSVDEYQNAANWSDYNDIICEIGGTPGGTGGVVTQATNFSFKYDFFCVDYDTGLNLNDFIVFEPEGSVGEVTYSGLKTTANSFTDSVKVTDGGVIENSTGTGKNGNYKISAKMGAKTCTVVFGTADKILTYSSLTANTGTTFSDFRSIYVASGITKIEENCFKNQNANPSAPDEFESLESIVIESTVKGIGDNAFVNCGNLKTVTIKNPEAFAISTGDNSPFKTCSKLEAIYVPAEAVTAYKAASGWSDYASKISKIE